MKPEEEQEMRRVMSEFNKNNIRWCLFRIGETMDDHDIDISVHKDDWNKIDKVFRDNGYMKSMQNFNLNHFAYRNKSIGFDCRHCDDWNEIYHLDERLYSNLILKDGIKRPCINYDLAHYVGHCLAKRNWKYKIEIRDLIKKADLKEVAVQLQLSMGMEDAERLLQSLKEDKFPNQWPFITNTIINHPVIFTKSFWKWLKSRFRLYPIIAIIGPDGSGKTTTSEKLVQELHKYKFPKAKRVYMGRGGENTLPVNKIGKRIKNKKNWMYKPYSFISFLDLLIRYWTKLHWQRRKHIFVTDRSYLDIFTMKNISMNTKSFYLLFFPKPKYIFYLHNDIGTLHSRRGHDKEDLKRQIDIFNQLAITSKIKTESSEQTIKEILRCLF